MQATNARNQTLISLRQGGIRDAQEHISQAARTSSRNSTMLEITPMARRCQHDRQRRQRRLTWSERMAPLQTRLPDRPTMYDVHLKAWICLRLLQSLFVTAAPYGLLARLLPQKMCETLLDRRGWHTLTCPPHKSAMQPWRRHGNNSHEAVHSVQSALLPADDLSA